MSHILIVEDETIIRSALRRLLERNQYEVSEAGSVQEAQERFSIPSFDLIVSDLRLPGAPGTELIKLAEGTPVLIMTSYASLRSAVDSMKMGAVDYIAKPFDHDEMLQTVARILHDRQQAAAAPAETSRNATPAADATTEDSINGDLGIIGRCGPMQDLFGKIRKVAPTDSNVLIQGESGTGKELVARAMHNLSRRAKAPMISVNCAAIPETLIESELFGHEKGAFTGASAGRAGLVEAADGGTLFLDEIGELPLEAQARLLRVLQEGEIRRVGSTQSQKVNVRLVAATHRDLKTLAKNGQYREDLYYRLHVIALKLPPLRERGADVLEIAKAFLARQSEAWAVRVCTSPARPSRPYGSTAGRGTCANWRMPSSARQFSVRVTRSALSYWVSILSSTRSTKISMNPAFRSVPLSRPATSQPRICRWKTIFSISYLSTRTT